MRKTLTTPETALSRLLVAFERELIDATDEEIVEAAQDLGMDVTMKGSAAWLGLFGSRPRRIEDFFDVEELRARHARLLSSRRDDED